MLLEVNESSSTLQLSLGLVLYRLVLYQDSRVGNVCVCVEEEVEFRDLSEAFKSLPSSLSSSWFSDLSRFPSGHNRKFL